MAEIVEFLSEEQLRIGQVTKVDKKRLTVSDERDRPQKVSPDKVIFRHSGALLEVRERLAALRDEAALRLDRMEVRAPAAGVVLARLAQPGSVLSGASPGHPVCSLYDPASLRVRVDVPQADVGKLFVGQRRISCRVGVTGADHFIVGIAHADRFDFPVKLVASSTFTQLTNREALVRTLDHRKAFRFR